MKKHLFTTIVLVCTCMLSAFTCGCSSKLTSKEKNSFDKSVIADLEILNEKEANAFQKIRESASQTKTDSVSPIEESQRTNRDGNKRICRET